MDKLERQVEKLVCENNSFRDKVKALEEKNADLSNQLNKLQSLFKSQLINKKKNVNLCFEIWFLSVHNKQKTWRKWENKKKIQNAKKQADRKNWDEKRESYLFIYLSTI